MRHLLTPNPHKARDAWEATLSWFRLRYRDGQSVTRALCRLSMRDACERIALYFQHDEALPRLYVGLPATHSGVLKQVAIDFGFQLNPADSPSAPIASLKVVKTLPWETSFTAHIVDGHLFATVGKGVGVFLPEPDSAETAPSWTLPLKPPLGLSAISNWEPTLTPDYLTTDTRNPDSWQLGRNLFCKPLHGGQQLNLYGRQSAVAHWLKQLVIQSLQAEAGNLIVIDGAGDLVPQLKRKPIITERLGQSVRYIDLNSSTHIVGFNPMASVPGECEEAHLLRWQAWMHRMGVPHPTLQLLPQAYEAGVRNLTALQTWLAQQERKGTSLPLDSLQASLARLTRHRLFREWLEWPTDPYEKLPAGVLLFSCKADGWAAAQLLHSVLLAALTMPNARLICHGIPWHLASTEQLAAHRQIVVSNAPCLPDSAILIAQTHEQGLGRLARRFQIRGERLLENMRLMTLGEAVLLHDKPLSDGWVPIFTRWHSAA